MAGANTADQAVIDFIAFNLERTRIMAAYLAERLDERADGDSDDNELAALALIATDIRDRLQRVTDDAIGLTKA
jgi:hypothetical protein